MSVDNQAISGLDFVSQKAIAVLQENVTRVDVSVVIKQVRKAPGAFMHYFSFMFIVDYQHH